MIFKPDLLYTQCGIIIILNSKSETPLEKITVASFKREKKGKNRTEPA